MVEPGSRPRVMIVEDEVSLNEIHARIMVHSGIDVVARAYDGEEALVFFRDAGPDGLPNLVLLDLMLPKVDGLDVLRQIKKEHPEVVVLMVSALSDKREEARAAGADGYVLKPMTMSSLIRVIKEIFEGDAHNGEFIDL